MAKKQPGYHPKKTSKGSIATWTLNNSFLTEKELKTLYTTLKGHMYMKYGKYNEEVVHLTILQGLRMSHSYNPQKSSKLVWFQSILKNIFLQHIDPKYNIHIRHHYSLDWTGSNDDDETQNMDILTEAFSKSNDADDAEKEDVINFTEDILELINNGDYFILKLKAKGESYSTMSKMLGLKTHKLSEMWQEERERLKIEIKSKLGWNDILDGRIPSNVAIKSKPGYKPKKPRVHKSPIRNCKICNKDFEFIVGMGPNTKTCSEECKIELRIALQKAFQKRYGAIRKEKTKQKREAKL